MITSQNANNKEKYKSLFELATKILNPDWEPEKYTEVSITEEEFVRGVHYAKYTDPNGTEFYYQPGLWKEDEKYFVKEDSEPEIVISSIADLFGNMETLIRQDDRFLMLPLDEDIFEIDANKRLINIPDHFKRNGVSVQGDEIAETLLFKIDRYFDAMDLDKCTMVVQWENQHNKYVTPITLKDTKSYPGQILFGWPLSSTLTEYAGPIKFSVRFIKYISNNIDSEEQIPMDKAADIVYSFNTLTATINVNPGLDYDIFDTKQDDPHHLFNFAITNSEDPSADFKAPEFLLNLETDPSGFKEYFLTKEDGSELRKCTLAVRAGSESLGHMTYQWWHAKHGIFGSPIGGNENVPTLLEPKPTVVNPKEDYYRAVKDEMGNIITYIKYFDGVEDKSKFTDEDVYVMNNVLTISGINPTYYDSKDSVTGEYWVVAKCRVGKANKEIKSYHVLLPTATPIEIVADLIEGVIGKPNGTLKINAKTHPNSYTTYSWMKCDSENGDFEIDTKAGVESDNYAPDAPGFYKVKITSEVNLDQTHAESKVVRVTNKPVAVEFADDYKVDKRHFANPARDNKIEAGLMATGDIVPGFITDLDRKLVSDKIEYSWYVDKDTSDGILDENGQIKSSAIFFAGPFAVPELSLAGFTEDRKLRCVAANYLNGEVAYSESAVFDIELGIVE